MRLKTVIIGAGLAAVTAITIGSCTKAKLISTNSTSNSSLVASAPVLTVTANGEVQLNGKTYRGIGVNYFDAFYRIIQKNSDVTYLAGLKYLSTNHIPFIRFAANGFWPNDWNLYLNDSTTYFRLFDRFVKQADSLHIGLIPSLFFNPCTVSDLKGEGYDKWGDPNSQTMALMRRYATTMVKRYKDSTAIWGWEFGNEMNGYVDLYDQANNVKFLPAVNPAGGTPQTRVASKDSLTTTMMRVAYNEFAKIVRVNDTKHILFTGNAMPEWNMWHRYSDSTAATVGSRWLYDQAADFGKILDAQNPTAIGTITVHFYHSSTTETGRFTNNDNTLIAQAMSTAASLKRPLFVGEFGSTETDEPYTQNYFESMLDAILVNKVPLSAIWVFDFSSQDKSFDVPYPIAVGNTRSYQLQEIINANAQLKTELGY